jgi:outer membrane biosynthesis protein TonB
MQSKSLAVSVGAHIAVLLVATLSLPWLKKDFEVPQPISVDLVDVSKVTETTRKAEKPVPKPEKPEKKPEDKPPPASHNASKEAAAPVPEKVEKKEDKKDAKKEKPVVTDDRKPDKKQAKKDVKKETAKPEPQKDFSSVLKNLVDAKDKPDNAKTPDLNADEKARQAAAQNAPLGQKMTMSEEDALRRQLGRCWNVPYGAKDADKTVVEIQMTVNPDRTLQFARVADASRYDSDSFFRAMADSALRAVRNPLCSPFELPPDKYQLWKNITVTFDASQMFQ